MIKAILLLLTVGISTVISKPAEWGTLKPNLYFAVKEQAMQQSVMGLAWMVKDWRTDKLIIRHAYQYQNPAENVKAFYTAHDG